MKTQDNNNSCALADTCTADQSTPGDAAEVAPSECTVASDPNTDDVKCANGDSTVTYKQKQDTTESKETKTDPEGSDLGTSIHTSHQLQTGSQERRTVVSVLQLQVWPMKQEVIKMTHVREQTSAVQMTDQLMTWSLACKT